MRFRQLAGNAAKAWCTEVELFSLEGHSYRVLVRSQRVTSCLQSRYSAKELEKLAEFLAPALAIPIHQNGRVRAADRSFSGKSDPTHYDAIWIRDSVWAYLGLRAQGARQADQVLLEMLNYVSTPAQLARFEAVIANPALRDSDDGHEGVVHIRFDGRSRDFADVQVEGHAQQWNHKQNDALGLLFDQVLRAIESGEVEMNRLPSSSWDAIALFPAYFAKLRFFEMEEAGSWEEIEKINASSIALVTSALESLRSLMRSRYSHARAAAAYLKVAAMRRKVSRYLRPESLDSLIGRGYRTLHAHLLKGGESPCYGADNPRFRTGDAALLNLIYPARLPGLKREHLEAVLRAIAPLIGRSGIRRYWRDSYQSGNFWYHDLATLLRRKAEAREKETFSSVQFEDREKQFIPDTEAQWFFDSWYSVAMGELAERYGGSHFRSEQLIFFNRAIGQLTGGSIRRPVLGADGRPVPPFVLPESYNWIVTDGGQFLVPSPIAPLNWAKASLSLALDRLRRRHQRCSE